MNELQAAASLGQMRLVQAWESSFGEHGKHTAQILLTHDDLSDRKRYLNARSTLRTLVDLGVVPVINENDTVVTDEIRFGDNDTLAALVANLVEADLLVILTDRDGMFDADPRNNPEAQLIYEARADDPSLDAVAGGTGGALGRGGMQTKLRAARLAARSGAHTIIIGGRIERVLDRLKAGERLGTLLSPERGMLAARKQWLAGHLQTRGTLVLDAGAVQALRQANKSLLPVGVKTVQGSFRRGEMVVCVGPDGVEVARGLANYSALEAQKIIGQSSEAIESILAIAPSRNLYTATTWCWYEPAEERNRGGSVRAADVAGAEEIGQVSTVFKFLGPNDRIVVEAFDDPKVEGVTCYLSRAKTGGVKGGLGLAEDRAEASIACRQVGPINFKGELKDGEEVFKERTSLVFKTMQVVRFLDKKRNTLVYLVYSDRMIEGSPQNAVTAIPILPWAH